MIKMTLATLIGAGLIGTGAQTLTPKALDVTAGSVKIELAGQGFKIDTAATPDFAVTLKTKGERTFTLRF